MARSVSNDNELDDDCHSDATWSSEAAVDRWILIAFIN